MNSLPRNAKLLLLAVVLVALAFSAHAFLSSSQVWSSGAGNLRFLILLLLSVAAARMKVRLPGLESNLSMNLPFILVAAFELPSSQALVIGSIATFAQCLFESKQQFNSAKMTFNVCNVLSAVSLASLTAGRALHFQSIATTSLFIATAAAVFFLADTIPVAGIIAATGNGRTWKLWREITGLTLPYFVLSAGTAMIVIGVGYYKGLTLLVALLLMYFVWSSFKRYFDHASARLQAFAARA